MFSRIVTLYLLLQRRIHFLCSSAQSSSYNAEFKAVFTLPCGAAHSRGSVRSCSLFQVRFRSKFLAEFGSEHGPEDAQDPCAIRSAATTEMCELAPLRAGQCLLICELDAEKHTSNSQECEPSLKAVVKPALSFYLQVSL